MSDETDTGTGTGNDVATQVTNILTPIAVAQLGPLGMLVVQLGVAATTAAIAKRHARADAAAGMTLADLQREAVELLAAPTFEQAVAQGEAEGKQATDDDGG